MKSRRRKLAPDSEIADGAVGFHAQQAIEKAVKAVLASRGIAYEYTHDLVRLARVRRSRPPGSRAQRPRVVASCIMNRARRTTVSAAADSLATLEREAERRGVSLTTLLAEAVDEKAAALRAARRPRVGVGRSTDGKAAADLTAEPVSHPPS